MWARLTEPYLDSRHCSSTRRFCCGRRHDDAQPVPVRQIGAWPLQTVSVATLFVGHHRV